MVGIHVTKSCGALARKHLRFCSLPLYLICVLQGALTEGAGRGIPDCTVADTRGHAVRVATALCSVLRERTLLALHRPLQCRDLCWIRNKKCSEKIQNRIHRSKIGVFTDQPAGGV